MICMTSEGEGLLKCRQEVMAKVENTIKERIGKKELKDLKELLLLEW